MWELMPIILGRLVSRLVVRLAQRERVLLAQKRSSDAEVYWSIFRRFADVAAATSDLL